MNRRFSELIEEFDHRSITHEEKKKIEAYAASMPARFAAIDELVAHEEAIVLEVIAFLKEQYPAFATHHVLAWEKGQRDLELVLRHCAQAMLLDDRAHLDDKLLFWLRTIVGASGMTPRFLVDGYNSLLKNTENALSEKAFAFIAPYLERVIEVMSEVPEPAVARV